MSSGREDGGCPRSGPGLPGCWPRLPEIWRGSRFVFREFRAPVSPSPLASGLPLSGCSPFSVESVHHRHRLMGRRWKTRRVRLLPKRAELDRRYRSSREQIRVRERNRMENRRKWDSIRQTVDHRRGFRSKADHRKVHRGSLGVSRGASFICGCSGAEPASSRFAVTGSDNGFEAVRLAGDAGFLANGQRYFTHDRSAAITVVIRIDHSESTSGARDRFGQGAVVERRRSVASGAQLSAGSSSSPSVSPCTVLASSAALSKSSRRSSSSSSSRLR